MKNIYQVTVWTTNGDYTTEIDNKYLLTTFASTVSEVKPDTVVRIGDLLIRAGDFVAINITEEEEEA